MSIILSLQEPTALHFTAGIIRGLSQTLTLKTCRILPVWSSTFPATPAIDLIE